MTEDQPAVQVIKISPKLKMFVESYLITWSATEAARRAGYKNANVTSVRLMKRTDVQAAIAERIKQAAMEADETLARFAEQARSNVADFILLEEIDYLDVLGKPVIDPITKETKKIKIMRGINWETVEQRGHLVKEISYDKRGNPMIKLHDGQAALIQIGKALGLFSDVEVTVNTVMKGYVGISPDDWDEPTP
jgi:phage terminase small subunit